MRIITDSSSDLTPELIERFKVDLVIPMKISIDGKEYLDKVDIQDEPFYHEILPACQSLPKTSQVTANEFCEIFSRYPDEELVVLPISSGLSGTYSAALVAKEMLGRKDIYVVDNKATALALALMVQIACEKRDAGLSAREVAEQVEALSGRVRVYALVETLRYLVLGGRLSKAAGLVGSALNLKPIITLKGGVLSAVGKARGTKAAVKLLRELVDANERIDTNYPVYYGHAFNDEGIALLQQAFPEYPTKAPVLTVGCIVGTHTGPKVTAISFISEVEA